MKNPEKPKYRWTDAWLLLAVALASKDRSANLVDIIACGDGINHAIFDESELHGGFCRLIQGEWIVDKGGLFEVTRRFKKEIQPHLSGFLSDQYETLIKVLGAEKNLTGETIPHPENIGKNYAGLTSEQIQKAYQQYTQKQ